MIHTIGFVISFIWKGCHVNLCQNCFIFRKEIMFSYLIYLFKNQTIFSILTIT